MDEENDDNSIKNPMKPFILIILFILFFTLFIPEWYYYRIDKIDLDDEDYGYISSHMGPIWGYYQAEGYDSDYGDESGIFFPFTGHIILAVFSIAILTCQILSIILLFQMQKKLDMVDHKNGDRNAPFKWRMILVLLILPVLIVFISIGILALSSMSFENFSYYGFGFSHAEGPRSWDSTFQIRGSFCVVLQLIAIAVYYIGVKKTLIKRWEQNFSRSFVPISLQKEKIKMPKVQWHDFMDYEEVQSQKNISPVYSRMAVSSFVLSVIGSSVWFIALFVVSSRPNISEIVPICFGINGIVLFTGISAIILGIAGFKTIQTKPDTYKGKGLAIAGIIIGTIIFVIMLLSLFALLLLPEDFGNQYDDIILLYNGLKHFFLNGI